jgi:tetratricopeptide (TPR) repeat protein
VYYYRGDFKGQVALLRAHQELAESLDDRAKLGMFYAWLGFSLYSRERYRESYQYLRKALEIGEEIDNQQVIGYACTWLSWTCVCLGLLDEAIGFGERAQQIAGLFPSDHYLYFKSLGGIGWACCWKGDGKRALGAGRTLVDYGRRHSNVRSMTLGNFIIGLSDFNAGDFPAAIEFSKKAIEVSADPFYSQFSKLGLGFAYAQNNQFQEAEEALRDVLSFSQEFGCENLGTSASVMLGFISIAKGNMTQGLKMIEEGQRTLLENESKCIFASWEHVLGHFYLEVVAKKAPISLSVMAKNVGFLLRNVPTAAKKAEEHLNKAIEVAQEIGAKTILGRACLDLGLLHKTRGRIDQARECISKAVQIFEECEVEMLVEQAKEALGTLP